MKFFSKYQNYRVVLRHGVPAEPITGRSAVHGLYVKFEHGVADVKDEETIESMLKHEKCGQDFIKEEAGDMVDPFAATRKDAEPGHNIAEIKYGTIEKFKKAKKPVSFTPEMTEYIQGLAVEMAKKMTKEILASAIAENESAEEVVEVDVPEEEIPTEPMEASEPQPKKSPGRPKKSTSKTTSKGTDANK